MISFFFKNVCSIFSEILLLVFKPFCNVVNCFITICLSYLERRCLDLNCYLVNNNKSPSRVWLNIINVLAWYHHPKIKTKSAARLPIIIIISWLSFYSNVVLTVGVISWLREVSDISSFEGGPSSRHDEVGRFVLIVVRHHCVPRLIRGWNKG